MNPESKAVCWWLAELSEKLAGSHCHEGIQDVKDSCLKEDQNVMLNSRLGHQHSDADSVCVADVLTGGSCNTTCSLISN